MSIFTMGIDVGSTASKCIILKDGKEIVAKAVISVGTGTSGPARAMKEALDQIGLSSVTELQGAVATGYGRNSLAKSKNLVIITAFVRLLINPPITGTTKNANLEYLYFLQTAFNTFNSSIFPLSNYLTIIHINILVRILISTYNSIH